MTSEASKQKKRERLASIGPEIYENGNKHAEGRSGFAA
jgi:hypothetical protein